MSQLRRLTNLVFLLILVAFRAHASSPEYKIGLSQDGNGEIIFYDSSGKISHRLTGFGRPEQIAATSDRTLAVFDRTQGLIVITDPRGDSVRKLPMPPGLADAEVFGMSFGFDKLAFAAGGKGVYLLSLDKPEEVKNFPAGELVSITGVAVQDAENLIVTSNLAKIGQTSVFHLNENGAQPLSSPVPENPPLGFSPRVVSCYARPEMVLLWDRSWRNSYVVRTSGPEIGIVKSLRKASWPIITAASCSDEANSVFSIEDLSVSRFKGESRSNVDVIYPPLSVASFSDGSFAVAYTREPDSGWPESRKNIDLPHAPETPWLSLIASAAGGIFLSLVLSAVFRRFAKERKAAAGPQTQAEAAGVIGFWKSLLLSAVFLAGSVLVYYGTPRGMYPGKSNTAALGAGFFLVAITGLFYRWRLVKSQTVLPAVNFQIALAVPLLAGFGGGAALLASGFMGGAYLVNLCLWTALLCFMLVQLIYPAWNPDKQAQIPFRWYDLVLPLGTGLFTLFYRLSDVPTNMHFDFTYNALYAQYLIDGDLPGIWTPGFVPAPIIGAWPEMLGLLIANPGQLGFRLGAAIFGLIGLTGAFFLALALYKDRRVAILSSLLLAGTIPFIHFNRLNTAGVTAGVAIWTMAAFLMAVRTGSIRWWLVMGFWTGHCFFVWPPSRVAPLALLISWLIFLVFKPRQVLRQFLGPVLALSFFILMISPLVPDWHRNIHMLFPRVQESMEVYKPNQGVDDARLLESFREPFKKSASWLTTAPDQCTQGTISPALNHILVFLLLAGCAVLVSESVLVSGLILPWVFCFFLFCGAFADSPPYYTRLLPTLYVATAIISRGITFAGDILSGNNRQVKKLIFAALTATVLFLGPVKEFRRYFTFETGRTGAYNMFEMVALGRKMREMAPQHELFLVITGRSDLSLDLAKRTGRLGELLPFIYDLKVSEVKELDRTLSSCTSRPSAFFIQAERINTDFAVIRGRYAEATLETIKGFHGETLGAVVTANTVCQPPRDGTSSE